jgi:hypothetical protein
VLRKVLQVLRMYVWFVCLGFWSWMKLFWSDYLAACPHPKCKGAHPHDGERILTII